MTGMLANTGFTHLSHLRQVFTVHYRAFTYIQRRYVIVANVIIKISTVYRRCLRKRTEIAYCLTRYSTTFGSYCFERFLYISLTLFVQTRLSLCTDAKCQRTRAAGGDSLADCCRRLFAVRRYAGPVGRMPFMLAGRQAASRRGTTQLAPSVVNSFTNRFYAGLERRLSNFTAIWCLV